MVKVSKEQLRALVAEAREKKPKVDLKKWASDAAEDLGIEIGKQLSGMDFTEATQRAIENMKMELSHANAPQMDKRQLTRAFIENTEALVEKAMRRVSNEIKQKVYEALADVTDAVDSAIPNTPDVDPNFLHWRGVVDRHLKRISGTDIDGWGISDGSLMNKFKRGDDPETIARAIVQDNAEE